MQGTTGTGAPMYRVVVPSGAAFGTHHPVVSIITNDADKRLLGLEEDRSG